MTKEKALSILYEHKVVVVENCIFHDMIKISKEEQKAIDYLCYHHDYWLCD
jgi:hypothetical protein